MEKATVANLLRTKPPRKIGRFVVVAVIVVVVLIGLTAGGVVAYTKMYDGRVYPGVSVKGTSLSGFTPSEVEQFVENLNNRYAKEGVPISFTDKLGEKRLVNFKIIVADDITPESIKLNSKALASLAMKFGRNGSGWQAFFAPVQLRLASKEITIPVVSDELRLLQTLKANLMPFEEMARDATVAYNVSTRQPTILKEQTGRVFDYTDLVADLERTMATASFEPITTALQVRVPLVTEQDVVSVLPKLESVLNQGPLSLHYIHPETKVRQEWPMTPQTIVEYLTVSRDESGTMVFDVHKEKITDFITKKISPAIYTEPHEAKFAMTEGKVESFQASRTGLTVDVPETVDQFTTAFRARNYSSEQPIQTVAVVVKIVEPTLKTADVNSLGISDVIGVGISTFKNSPANRIKNIAHAVSKLNGLLIKPGEEFSANTSAGPYTTENGYLPEMVIKGNRIIPEVGGGMCQVGTTLFRMAMNSGFPITERTNHSLVVSYYSDPFNGNPGTDATLYEPVLDFKFKNETDGYLLMQTEMDRVKGELRFTLWGKPDGRSGSYTHPVVKRWIPAGESQTTYVDDGSLAPGQKKCQSAFRGAVASFTYSRITPAGEKVDQVFDSYYRPLPQICLEGVAPGSLCDGKVCVVSPAPAEEVLVETP